MYCKDFHFLKVQCPLHRCPKLSVWLLSLLKIGEEIVISILDFTVSIFLLYSNHSFSIADQLELGLVFWGKFSPMPSESTLLLIDSTLTPWWAGRIQFLHSLHCKVLFMVNCMYHYFSTHSLVETVSSRKAFNLNIALWLPDKLLPLHSNM